MIPWDLWTLIYQQCENDKKTQGKIIQLCKETKKRLQKNHIKKSAFILPNVYELTELFHQKTTFQMQLFQLNLEKSVGLFFPFWFNYNKEILPNYNVIKNCSTFALFFTMASVEWLHNFSSTPFRKENTMEFFSKFFEIYKCENIFLSLETAYFLCLHRVEIASKGFHSKSEYIFTILKSIWTYFAKFFIFKYSNIFNYSNTPPINSTYLYSHLPIDFGETHAIPLVIGSGKIIEFARLASWLFSMKQLNFEFDIKSLKTIMINAFIFSNIETNKERVLQKRIDEIKSHLEKEEERFFTLLNDHLKNF